jgi:hypothetical protein
MDEDALIAISSLSLLFSSKEVRLPPAAGGRTGSTATSSSFPAAVPSKSASMLNPTLSVNDENHSVILPTPPLQITVDRSTNQIASPPRKCNVPSLARQLSFSRFAQLEEECKPCDELKTGPYSALIYDRVPQRNVSTRMTFPYRFAAQSTALSMIRTK